MSRNSALVESICYFGTSGARRLSRDHGFVDVFLLRGMHAHQGLDRLDDPLGVANEIAVDLFRRQVLDHAGKLPAEMQDLAVRPAHGGKAVALLAESWQAADRHCLRRRARARPPAPEPPCWPPRSVPRRFRGVASSSVSTIDRSRSRLPISATWLRCSSRPAAAVMLLRRSRRRGSRRGAH